MQDRDTTIRSRELGDGLRQAMHNAGMNGTEAARQLGWSQSRISRLINGKRGGTEVDVSAFLAICHVKGKERQRLLKLCVDVDKPGWLQQHGSRLPKQLRTLIDHEDKAIAISDFQSMLVPGLLQTGDYARALSLGKGTLPENEIEERVQARLARQSLLSRLRPPGFIFFLHEVALRLPVGPPSVMSEQLHQLLRLSVRTNISVRIVPTRIGSHAGIAGPFTLLEFAEFKPVVYLESETSSLFLEEREEITAYRRILSRLAETALDEGQSREVIGEVATELYGD